MKHVRIALGIAVVAGALASAALLVAPDNRSTRYLLPAGYIGLVRVQYGVWRAAPLPLEDGRYLVRVPASGLVRTCTRLPEGMHEPEDFYYVAGGSRTRLRAEYDPYPVGTTPPPPMVFGGTVGVVNDGPPTEEWWIGPEATIPASPTGPDPAVRPGR